MQHIKRSTHSVLLEPFGRNTAPAVALSAMLILEEQDDDLMLVLPADHVIRDVPAFHAALERAGLRRNRANWCYSVLCRLPLPLFSKKTFTSPTFYSWWQERKIIEVWKKEDKEFLSCDEISDPLSLVSKQSYTEPPLRETTYSFSDFQRRKT